MTRRRGVLVLLLCLSIIPLWFAAVRIEAWQLAARQQPLVQAQARELDRQLARLAFLPRLLAADPRIVTALNGGSAAERSASQARASRLLADVQSDSQLAEAFLMDRNGLTISASNFAEQTSFVGWNYGFRPYFLGAVSGADATHFAVGATTGKPGYFVASPVRASVGQSAALGVIVAKTELDALVDAWRQQPHDTVVLDALGVVILSTDPGLLYVSRDELSAAEQAAIASERRYPLDPGRRLGKLSRDMGASQTLVGEPWTLQALVPHRQVRLAAIRDVLVLVMLAGFAALVARLLGQRRRLAQARERDAQSLAREVELRTRQLESAQSALIARSNFEMLGRMSAAINHEINQPLASLRLNLASARTLLERDAPDLNELGEIVIDSDRTTRRIGRVVATLRSVAGAPHPPRVPIPVQTLIDEVAATLARERPRAYARLQCKPVPGQPSVLGDAVQLQQALLNLLNNAFDACLERADGAVELSAMPQCKDGVAIRVADNGCGVAPDFVEQLFEPFASSTTRAGGLGLGLALAQEITERHAGSLEYRPNDPNGSVFTLYLPTGPAA